MKRIIACCGLDCAACDARIATINNDNVLRAKTAEKWRKIHNVPNMTADMINCTGCLEAGAKIGHCAECEIRKCAISNNFQTCAECSKMGSCDLLKNIFKFAPEALSNLKALN